MKRKLLFLFVVISLVCLSGCHSAEPNATDTPDTTAASAVTVTSAPTEAPTAPKPTQPPEELGIPKTLFEDMYNDCGNRLFLQLTLDDGTVIGPFETRRMENNLSGLWDNISPTQEQDITDCPEWVTVTSGDGSRVFTVYKTEPVCVRYDKDGKTYWYCDEGNDYPFSETNSKAIVSNMEAMSFLPISFSDGGKEPLQVYAEEALPRRLSELTPGNMNRIRDYTVVSVKVEGASDNFVHGIVSYAGIPENEVNILTPYPPEPGTGEYEGMVICKQRVYLAKQPDGQWQEICGSVYSDHVNGETMFPRREDTTVLSNPAAENILKESTANLEAVRRLETDYEVVNATADLFLQVVRAAALCNTEEPDFAPFFTGDAPDKLGVKTLMNEMVYWENAAINNGELESPYLPYGIYIKENTAAIDCGRVILYFVKTEDVWCIDDVSLPWYP